MRHYWRDLGILLLLVTIVFGQTVAFDFVHYDDTQLVVSNPHVNRGVTADGLVWIATPAAGGTANWMPLTYLTYMVECELWGLNAAGFHCTNLILHLANICLLYDLLRRAGISREIAWMTTAVFALHPLQTQTVCWIGERKGLLATFFALAAFDSWVLSVRNASSGWKNSALLFYAASLCSKQMYVTLPFFMLLLDVWPLKRMQLRGTQADPLSATEPTPSHSHAVSNSPLGLVLEKLPFFALAVAGVVVAVVAQSAGGTIGTMSDYPLAVRAGNAVLSYGLLLRWMIWPSGLAVYYPHPGTNLPWSDVWTSGVLLLLITLTVVSYARRHRGPLVGWLWFVGGLVPVIGLVQLATQQLGLRYCYFPIIGLVLGLGAFMEQCWPKWIASRASRITATVLTSAMMLVSMVEAARWSDTATLFKHAIAVTRADDLTHYTLAEFYLNVGNRPAAIEHFAAAADLAPIDQPLKAGRAVRRLDAARYSLAKVLIDEGQIPAAKRLLETIVTESPGVAAAWDELGYLALADQDLPHARQYLERAIELDGQLAGAHNNLGILSMMEGQPDAAMEHFRKALQIDPHHEGARANLERCTLERRQRLGL